jgi:hypothetical protein
MAKTTTLRGPGRPRRPGGSTDTLIIRVPSGMRARIADIAAQARRSMNAVVVEALVLQLDRIEAATTVEEVMARVEVLEAKVRTLEERTDPRIHPYDD